MNEAQGNVNKAEGNLNGAEGKLQPGQGILFPASRIIKEPFRMMRKGSFAKDMINLPVKLLDASDAVNSRQRVDLVFQNSP